MPNGHDHESLSIEEMRRRVKQHDEEESLWKDTKKELSGKERLVLHDAYKCVLVSGREFPILFQVNLHGSGMIRVGRKPDLNTNTITGWEDFLCNGHNRQVSAVTIILKDEIKFIKGTKCNLWGAHTKVYLYEKITDFFG